MTIPMNNVCSWMLKTILRQIVVVQHMQMWSTLQVSTKFQTNMVYHELKDA